MDSKSDECKETLNETHGDETAERLTRVITEEAREKWIIPHNLSSVRLSIGSHEKLCRPADSRIHIFKMEKEKENTNQDLPNNTQQNCPSNVRVLPGKQDLREIITIISAWQEY